MKYSRGSKISFKPLIVGWVPTKENLEKVKKGEKLKGQWFYERQYNPVYRWIFENFYAG